MGNFKASLTFDIKRIMIGLTNCIALDIDKPFGIKKCKNLPNCYVTNLNLW
jgi:hypothetical protein